MSFFFFFLEGKTGILGSLLRGKLSYLTLCWGSSSILPLDYEMISRFVSFSLQRALKHTHSSVQFISVAQTCPTLFNPMNCSTLVSPVHHQLLELAQTHVHIVSDAIQPSYPLLSPSPAFNLSQHQGLFQSQFLPSGGQSIGVPALTSVLPMNIQD